MHQDRRTGVLMKLAESSDVIDMGVRADDSLYGELMAAEQIQDAGDFVARVHDQGFASDGITNDGAVAMQYSHGDGNKNSSFGGSIQGGQAFAHARDYSIGPAMSWEGRYIVCGSL